MKKTLSLLISLTLLNQIAFGALGDANLWKERRAVVLAALPAAPAARPPMTVKTILNQMPAIKDPLARTESFKNPLKNGPLKPEFKNLLEAIPLSHSRIQEIYNAPNSQAQPVVILQDVHLNAEAQANIAVVLQHMIDEKQIGAIGIEGAFGPLNFAEFHELNNAVLMQKIAQAFLEKSFLAAPSYVGITNPNTDIQFIGVDDFEHHTANVKAYTDSLAEKSSLAKALVKLESELAELKRQNFSPNLKRFDDLKTAYALNQIGLAAYVKGVAAYQTGYDFVAEQFLEAAHLEDSLNLPLIEKERKFVLQKLTHKLNKEDLNQLMGQSMAYQLGRIDFGGYYRYLKTLCESNGIDLSQTPGFDNYIRYVLLSNEVQAKDLFASIKKLEKKAAHILAKTKEEQILLDKSEYLSLVRKLLSFSLTPDEWDEFKAAEDNNEIREKSLNLSNHKKFYEQAHARSRLMVEHLLSKADSKHQGPKVLVTGGFHSPDIAAQLKQENIPYVVVSPKITKVELSEGTSYLSVFEREKTPLDQLFSGNKLFVSPVVVQTASPRLTTHLLGTFWHHLNLSGVVSFISRGKKIFVSTSLPKGHKNLERLMLANGENGLGAGFNGTLSTAPEQQTAWETPAFQWLGNKIIGESFGVLVELLWATLVFSFAHTIVNWIDVLPQIIFSFWTHSAFNQLVLAGVIKGPLASIGNPGSRPNSEAKKLYEFLFESLSDEDIQNIHLSLLSASTDYDLFIKQKVEKTEQDQQDTTVINYFFTPSNKLDRRKVIDTWKEAETKRLRVDTPDKSPPLFFGSNYDVGEKIYQGGYGIIYQGTDRRTGDKVILKTNRIRPDLGFDKFILDSAVLVRERDVLRQTTPRIGGKITPNLREAGFDATSNKFYLAMDFIEGRNLSDWKESPISLEEFLIVLRTIISFQEETNLIHNDLKPGQFIVELDENGKIAKAWILDMASAVSSEPSRKRQIGDGISSVGYKAPERPEFLSTLKSDTYSVGIMMKELIPSESFYDHETQKVIDDLIEQTTGKAIIRPSLEELYYALDNIIQVGRGGQVNSAPNLDYVPTPEEITNAQNLIKTLTLTNDWKNFLRTPHVNGTSPEEKAILVRTLAIKFPEFSSKIFHIDDGFIQELESLLTRVSGTENPAKGNYSSDWWELIFEAKDPKTGQKLLSIPIIHKAIVGNNPIINGSDSTDPRLVFLNHLAPNWTMKILSPFNDDQLKMILNGIKTARFTSGVDFGDAEVNLGLIPSLRDRFGEFGDTLIYKYLVGPLIEDLGYRGFPILMGVGFYWLTPMAAPFLMTLVVILFGIEFVKAHGANNQITPFVISILTGAGIIYSFVFGHMGFIWLVFLIHPFINTAVDQYRKARQRRADQMFVGTVVSALSSNQPREAAADQIMRLVPLDKMGLNENWPTRRLPVLKLQELGASLQQELRTIITQENQPPQQTTEKIRDLLFILRYVLTDQEMAQFVKNLDVMLTEIKNEEGAAEIFIWLDKNEDTAVEQAVKLIEKFLEEDGSLQRNKQVVLLNENDNVKVRVLAHFKHLSPEQVRMASPELNPDVISLLRNTSAQKNLTAILEASTKHFLIPSGADVPPAFFDTSNANLSTEDRALLNRVLVITLILQTLNTAVQLNTSQLPNWQAIRQALIAA